MQMKPELEWRMWRQLKGAFGVDRLIFTPRLPKMDGYTFAQADDMGEALQLAGDGMRIFLEPSGYNSMDKWGPMQRDKVDPIFILGNTESDNMQYAKVNETYKIYTPNTTVLYGINAAAIALAYWYGQ